MDILTYILASKAGAASNKNIDAAGLTWFDTGIVMMNEPSSGKLFTDLEAAKKVQSPTSSNINALAWFANDCYSLFNFDKDMQSDGVSSAYAERLIKNFNALVTNGVVTKSMVTSSTYVFSAAADTNNPNLWVGVSFVYSPARKELYAYNLLDDSRYILFGLEGIRVLEDRLSIYDKTLSLAGKAADAKAVGDALANISQGGGNADQATPESFGAKGDGVTDDSAAITLALSASKNVVFDGTKTYAVGSTIVIPADSMVDFHGATVVPMGNHDVIQVKPGSLIENLVVRCTDVSGWDSSVLLFNGVDKFGASNPTRIHNVKLYNDTTWNDGIENAGNGLYLYVDEPGHVVEGLAVTDLMTCGFGKGVYIHGMDGAAEFEVDSVAFIGANNFCKYWSFKDSYGIYIEAEHKQDRITNNFFTDLNIQSDSYGGTKYGIYCNGFANYFSGCLYDFFWMNPNDPVKAIYFGRSSNSNVVETMSGTVYDDGYVTDLGIANRVMNRFYDGKILLPSNSGYYGGVNMFGNQDDILSFADKNMVCTLESIDGEPFYGNLSNVFDPTPFKVLTYAEAVSGTRNMNARITINFRKAVKEITNLILQFVRKSEPSSIRVTFYGESEVRVVYDTSDNQNHDVIISPVLNNYSYSGYSSGVLNVAKIVVELGGFTNPDGNGIIKEWSLERIMATGSNVTGNTWLRRDGGKVFGNVEFAENSYPVVTGANGKKYKLTVSENGTLLPVEMQETEEEAPEVAVLTPTLAAGPTWYDTETSGIGQNEITSVSFDANYEASGNEDASWFCDENGVGHIVAFRNGTGVTIVPTTGSENIRLNMDSKNMFANDGTKANFSNLTSITGTEMWVANKNTDMSYVCQKNNVLTTTIHIPVGVTYISYAFQNCTSLTTPPELPDGLVSMVSAFAACSSLQYLPDIPTTVTNMNYAFHGCTFATKAPSVIPAGVTAMEGTFMQCRRIDGTIEVNAVKINSYAACFEHTCADSGSITLTGTSTYLETLAATNALGKVTVAT